MEKDEQMKETQTAEAGKTQEPEEMTTGEAETAEPEETDAKPDRKEKKAVRKLESELAATQKKLEELERALAEEKDSRMRLAAEYDNFRRRSKAEKDGIYADAYTDAVKEILPIIDNLERAETFENAEDVKKGVQMILTAARDALKKMGVEEIEAAGVAFDPNLHNAVMHTEDESLGENVITAVFQKGYRKGDKIIRYAMVSVAN